VVFDRRGWNAAAILFPTRASGGRPRSTDDSFDPQFATRGVEKHRHRAVYFTESSTCHFHPVELAAIMKHRDGDTVLAESFLETRAKILEIAATLDRIDRAAEAQPLGDETAEKRQLIEQAIAILQSDDVGRAERLQHLFSRGYDSNWRSEFGLAAT
jgi:hypothetical protein